MQNLTKNGIKDDRLLFVKSHHGIPDLLELFICSQPVHKRVNNFFEWTRALGFASLRLELVWHSKKIIHSFGNRSRTNKSSKSGIPGLYFTNNGVLSQF